VADDDRAKHERVRDAYDAVASDYDRALADELNGKPLDRKLLEAFVELVVEGTIADVGCGPGHVTRFLAGLHDDVIGIDLSAVMIDVAKEHAPDLEFQVASMLDLPVRNGAWAGAVTFYSVIHFHDGQRAGAWRELARAIRPGGWLLVAFHVDSADHQAGEINHVTEWSGRVVDLDGHFLDPVNVIGELELAGFSVVAQVDRAPNPSVEYPSRRCYVLVQRRP
jgi:SAM-dependent methyltransferase